MLQPQNQREEHGDTILEPEEGSRLAGLLGEGQSRGEQVGIVILADETIP